MDLEKSKNKMRTIVYVCPVDHAGTSVFVKGWMSADENTHSIPMILVHDLGDSPDDYTHLAEKFVQSGFNVYTYELRIPSRRLKGPVMLNFDTHVKDLLQVVSWIKYKEGGRKPIVVSQGFGALVTLHFVQRFSKFLAATVFVSPLFSLKHNVSPFKRLMIRSLAQVFPYMTTPLRLKHRLSEPVKKEVRRKKMKFPIFFVEDVLIGISKTHKLFSRIRIPTLILCPKKDPISRYDFLKRLISKHKNEEMISLVRLETEGHQILTRGDDVLDKIWSILTPWLEAYGISKKQ